jgi:hypothetical protein
MMRMVKLRRRRRRVGSSHTKKYGTTLRSLTPGTLPQQNMRYVQQVLLHLLLLIPLQGVPWENARLEVDHCQEIIPVRNLLHEKYNLIVFRWYNIPYNSSKEKAKTPNSTKVASAEAASQATAADEEDSAPLDFDTFVPSYDPSLPVPSEAPAVPESSFSIPAPSTTMVSRDEAFSRALSAMYWGGYWTAVYHVSPLRACYWVLLTHRLACSAKISILLRRLSRSKIIKSTKMMMKLLRMMLKIWYLLSGNCQKVIGKVRIQSYGIIYCSSVCYPRLWHINE